MKKNKQRNRGRLPFKFICEISMTQYESWLIILFFFCNNLSRFYLCDTLTRAHTQSHARSRTHTLRHSCCHARPISKQLMFYYQICLPLTYMQYYRLGTVLPVAQQLPSIQNTKDKNMRENKERAAPPTNSYKELNDSKIIPAIKYQGMKSFRKIIILMKKIIHRPTPSSCSSEILNILSNLTI